MGLKGPQARIAAISGWVPMIAITRLRLYAKTCKLIVLDKTIKSMTTFKQIIGRGTRIEEDHNKFYFTVMDFKKATELFTEIQPEISDHTNFQMAERSLRLAVAELARTLDEASRA